jgi:uncharacterized protein YggE
MTRDEAFADAKRRARELIEGDELALGVVVFIDALAKAKIDPPMHHADISHGVMLAAAGDVQGVKAWVEKFQ